jgi:hypothetical protein
VHDRLKVQRQEASSITPSTSVQSRIVLGIDTTNAPSRNVPEASVVKSEQIRHAI